METIATNPCFVRIFLEQTSHPEKPFEVVHVEQSKIEPGLGETVITVICYIDGKMYAPQIEDKIDAIAMPIWCYILCPESYHDTNAEAIKYKHFVSYEKCRE